MNFLFPFFGPVGLPVARQGAMADPYEIRRPPPVPEKAGTESEQLPRTPTPHRVAWVHLLFRFTAKKGK